MFIRNDINRKFKKDFQFMKYVKYKPLGRTLTKKKIEKFEKINDIVLPEDYKYFLTHIGNGVCIYTKSRPHLFLNTNGGKRYVYGLNKQMLGKRNNLFSKEFLFDKDFLTRYGENSKDWFEDCLSPTHDDPICDTCKNVYDCPFACTDALEENYGIPYYRGVLPICKAGCTYQYCLVLTGCHKGEVWQDNELSDFFKNNSSFTEFLKWVSDTPII